MGTAYAAILFDLDGTLLDSVELIVRGFQHATEAHLGAPVARDSVVPTIGRALPVVMEELAPGQGPALQATYDRFVRENHDRLARLYPGVAATLDELAARGYRQGIVTSKRRPIAQLAFDAFPLERHAEVVICLEDVPRAKPAPDPLLIAAARLGLAPADCLYVGDSIHDLVAARAAGMPAAAALWGPNPAAALQAERPRHELATIEALLPLCPPRRAAAPPSG